MSTFPIELIPFAKTLGVEIIEASAECVVGMLLVRPELCTAGATLHGGAVMAFADSLGAIGAFLSLPEGAKATTTLESQLLERRQSRRDRHRRGNTRSFRQTHRRLANEDQRRRRQDRRADHSNADGFDLIA